jgi:hypothetical protein
MKTRTWWSSLVVLMIIAWLIPAEAPGQLPVDLVVTAVSGPSVAQIGGFIAVSVTVQNQSPFAVSAFRIGFYYSTDAGISTADFLAGTCAVAGLAAGDSVTCAGSIEVPLFFNPGTYYWGAIADDLQQVAEIDEQNNVRIADTGPIAFTGTSAGEQLGVFRDGFWFLDTNGNRVFDGCGVDRCINFGMPGDLPIVGDWNGSGNKKVGVFRDGIWYLDSNGNGQFDGCGVDGCLNFGTTGDIPVLGDWTGSGQVRLGVFRDGIWYLDVNGNGRFDGCGVGQDRCINFGAAGDVPVVGGRTIMVFRQGVWFIDVNQNHQFDGCGVDACVSFGTADDHPILGDWDKTLALKLGIYRQGVWFLDHQTNGIFDGCGVDECVSFGGPNDRPVVGRW